jgi:hypothetical protein
VSRAVFAESVTLATLMGPPRDGPSRALGRDGV